MYAQCEGNQGSPRGSGAGLGEELLHRAQRARHPPRHLRLRCETIVTPYFVRPRAHFKKGQLKSDAPSHVLKTPDIDNLAKFVLDALQKNILADDKFVTTLVVHKRWCSTENEQRTEIELRVLN